MSTFLSGSSKVALIPARSGSSLLDKNLRSFGGQPLLSRAVRSALEAGIFDEVWVSSDSERYLDLALQEGASVHLRNHWAATSEATAQDALDDFLEASRFQSVTWLQPTSPLRSPVHIRKAMEVFTQSETCGVMSVTRLKQLPEKTVQLDAAGLIEVSGNPFQNRQGMDLERYYPNGAIYILPKLLDGKFSFSETRFKPYFMSGLSSWDVDFEEDFELGELFGHETTN